MQKGKEDSALRVICNHGSIDSLDSIAILIFFVWPLSELKQRERHKKGEREKRVEESVYGTVEIPSQGSR